MVSTETLLQSHGREMDEYRSEVHSYEDKSNAIARDLPSYLFTPSNHLVVYYPNGLEGPVYEWDKGQKKNQTSAHLFRLHHDDLAVSHLCGICLLVQGAGKNHRI